MDTIQKPLTCRQAAQALGISEHTIRSWIASREISFVRVGKRAIRIMPTEVKRLLRDGLVPAIGHD